MSHTVLFFGLGRIGLTQSLVFAEQGLKVYGYDINPEVADSILRGELPFYEPGMEELLGKHCGKNFIPVKEWNSIIHEVDAILLTLGTHAPNSESCLTDDFKVDSHYSIIDEVFSNPRRKKGILFVFRTTLPIGTLDLIRTHIGKKFGMTESEDYYLAFVPERLMEGAAISEEEHLPKIIGAYTDDGFRAAEKVFEQVGGPIIRVANPRTAEFCKLIDNSWRNTLFSYSNEISLYAHQHNIDILEAIGAVNREYKRNSIPFPGYVSGYCLGKDPYIFEYGFNTTARKRDFQSVWYYGRRTNDYLIDFTVERVLANSKKSPADMCVTMLGLSFKKDIDDFRMSHSIMLIDALLAKGVKRFKVYDPNLDKNRYTKIPDTLNGKVVFQSAEVSRGLFDGSDSVIVAVNHSRLAEMNHVPTLAPLLSGVNFLFDGWNVWREAGKIDGLTYEALGFNPAKEGK